VPHSEASRVAAGVGREGPVEHADISALTVEGQRDQVAVDVDGRHEHDHQRPDDERDEQGRARVPVLLAPGRVADRQVPVVNEPFLLCLSENPILSRLMTILNHV